MAGVVHIPWYATGLRHDKLAVALADISPVAALRRAHLLVYRLRDDRYKFLQVAEFEEKSTSSATGTGPSSPTSACCARAGTRSRSSTAGPTWWPPGRSSPRSRYAAGDEAPASGAAEAA